MKVKTWIILGVSITIAVGAIAFWVYEARQPGRYDDFAQCLTEKGVKFYGAFWCSHCQNQKRLFGKSAKYLPYIECSTPNGRQQLGVCKEAGIDGYPTWVFPDGTQEGGELSLEVLAQKSGCTLFP